MKNNLFIIKFICFLFLITNLNANNLEVTSSQVKLDKKDSKIILKGNVNATDENNNLLKAEEAGALLYSSSNEFYLGFS